MQGSLVKIAPALRTLAVALMLALAGASPAAARTSRQRTVTMTGSLTIAWHGDLTRGCAAVGQCGVSGMLQILPSGPQTRHSALLLLPLSAWQHLQNPCPGARPDVEDPKTPDPVA